MPPPDPALARRAPGGELGSQVERIHMRGRADTKHRQRYLNITNEELRKAITGACVNTMC